VAKYINPRLAPRTDETETTGSIGLFGPDASRIAAALTSVNRSTLEALPMYSHIVGTGEFVDVAHVPDLGVDGYRLVVPRASLRGVHDRAVSEGARAIGASAVESARIEAGRPLWGVDMDESTLPQEVNLESLGAISFTKGCYTGQEVVARLHFRGHVNRRLMGLRVDGSIAPLRGSELTSVENAVCGDVRSSAVSPRFGPIALAMVRREVDTGAALSVRIDGNEVRAEVAALPFGG
jgi:folate-binding protein YgfZ